MKRLPTADRWELWRQAVEIGIGLAELHKHDRAATGLRDLLLNGLDLIERGDSCTEQGVFVPALSIQLEAAGSGRWTNTEPIRLTWTE